jgi:formylmethanofuran dehydrogenase subunit A
MPGSGPSGWSGTSAVQDPWRVVMSTDHPNGGSFLAYPQIIRLLMDRNLPHRDSQHGASGGAREITPPDLEREYTLNEICIITRAGPARLLGLSHKGHLGSGSGCGRDDLYTP